MSSVLVSLQRVSSLEHVGGDLPPTQYTTSCHTRIRRSVLCGREVTFYTVGYEWIPFW